MTNDLPVLRLDSQGPQGGEEIVEAWEGPSGTVAVVRHGGGNLRLRVNSSYNLGTTSSAVNERLQGQIPFLLRPDARSVFFLGLGTGLTASGAMHFPFDRLTVCEVDRGVVRASRDHFGPWLEGLFEDPRVRVIPEDGRNWLAVSGGRFVQWLPIFDISPDELSILARTMLEVFPSVTLWRRSFSPVFPVYALVGSMDDRPLDMAGLRRGLGRLRASGDLDERTWILNIPLAAYVANLSRLRERFADQPLNTDDRTLLETRPRSRRGSRRAPGPAGPSPGASCCGSAKTCSRPLRRNRTPTWRTRRPPSAPRSGRGPPSTAAKWRGGWATKRLPGPTCRATATGSRRTAPAQGRTRFPERTVSPAGRRRVTPGALGA